MTVTNSNGERGQVSRRTVAKGAAWSVPVVALAAVAPALAASASPAAQPPMCGSDGTGGTDLSVAGAPTATYTLGSDNTTLSMDISLQGIQMQGLIDYYSATSGGTVQVAFYRLTRTGQPAGVNVSDSPMPDDATGYPAALPLPTITISNEGAIERIETPLDVDLAGTPMPVAEGTVFAPGTPTTGDPTSLTWTDSGNVSHSLTSFSTAGYQDVYTLELFDANGNTIPIATGVDDDGNPTGSSPTQRIGLNLNSDPGSGSAATVGCAIRG